jgi:hypothetical protein
MGWAEDVLTFALLGENKVEPFLAASTIFSENTKLSPQLGVLLAGLVYRTLGPLELRRESSAMGEDVFADELEDLESFEDELDLEDAEF